MFRAIGISVSDFVMITAAHPSDQAGIEIGPSVELARNVTLDYSGGLKIGRGVAISEGAKIFTHAHRLDGSENWHANGISFSPLEIGDYVWIGSGAIIVERVRRIGRGAVIAAGAVLTSDVQDFEVVAGVPARTVAMRTITT